VSDAVAGEEGAVGQELGVGLQLRVQTAHVIGLQLLLGNN
jgi:hypothetical protein